jgi:hypothetical protein
VEPSPPLASSYPPTWLEVVCPDAATLRSVSEDLLVAVMERMCRRGMVKMVASAFLSFSESALEGDWPKASQPRQPMDDQAAGSWQFVFSQRSMVSLN